MTKIKICGLKTREIVTLCDHLKADSIGFIAYPPSHRHVSAEEYAQLAPLAQYSQTVLVTVNADNAMLDGYVKQHRPDFIQCHGKESPKRCQELRERYRTGIIKAFPIASEADFSDVERYSLAADIFLFDAKPAHGELPGGNAKSFPWKLLHGQEFSKPWMLSGGLNRKNLQTAIDDSGANYLDLSSGVEVVSARSDEKEKSAEKIRALLATVKG